MATANMPIDDGDAPVRAPAKPAKKKAKKKATGKRPGRPEAVAKERAQFAAEGEARLAQAPRRQMPRTDLDPPRQTRQMNRQTTRDGAVVVEGRDGEVLTRRHIQTGPDRFEIPRHLIPEGWDYQWNRYSVVGDTNLGETVKMHANGWRPVPAERHPGIWFEPGKKGEIVLDGLRLEERPMALSIEAKAEDTMAARKLMRDQTDALKLTEKLPQGFSDARKYRGTGLQGRVAMAIDPNLTLPQAGQYETSED